MSTLVVALCPFMESFVRGWSPPSSRGLEQGPRRGLLNDCHLVQRNETVVHIVIENSVLTLAAICVLHNHGGSISWLDRLILERFQSILNFHSSSQNKNKTTDHCTAWLGWAGHTIEQAQTWGNLIAIFSALLVIFYQPLNNLQLFIWSRVSNKPAHTQDRPALSF